MTIRRLPFKDQRGIALIIVLVMLIVIAVIGITSMQSTKFEETMVGNLKEQSLSFNMAEAALRSAETYLEGNAVAAFDGSVNGLYYSTSQSRPLWSDSSTTGWIVRAGTVTEVAQQPDYIIEELPTVYNQSVSTSADEPLEEKPLYRITARGYGLTGNSSTVLQSVYKR